MTSSRYDVVVLGAGPYGLAASAHLCNAGFHTATFGRAMEFWKNQMPAGMFLRSSWDASHISDPKRAWTLNTFTAAKNVHLSTPIPLAGFVQYGEWFQRQAAPTLDPRRVRSIIPTADGFDVILEDQEVVQAKRVVVAGGIAPFAHIPPQFADLPAGLVSHTADHHDLSVFANQRVMVIGSGQSAIESAALLKEAGAEVEVVARAPFLRWLKRSGWLHTKLFRPISRILYSTTDVGPPGLSQLVARPNLFRRLPGIWQSWVAYRSIRPAAASWLFSRVDGVRMNFHRQIQAVTTKGKQLEAHLDSGKIRRVDHLLLATGYRVDIRKYDYLPQALTDSLDIVNGYPILSPGFESSQPGLHFLGAPAAISFGPLMRFVSGTSFAARQLTSHIVSNGGTRRRHPSQLQLA